LRNKIRERSINGFEKVYSIKKEVFLSRFMCFNPVLCFNYALTLSLPEKANILKKVDAKMSHYNKAASNTAN